MELNKEEKKFHDWLLQFIDRRGHTFERGFYVVLKDPAGTILYNASKEYKQWYIIKFNEYKKIK